MCANASIYLNKVRGAPNPMGPVGPKPTAYAPHMNQVVFCSKNQIGVACCAGFCVCVCILRVPDQNGVSQA